MPNMNTKICRGNHGCSELKEGKKAKAWPSPNCVSMLLRSSSTPPTACTATNAKIVQPTMATTNCTASVIATPHMPLSTLYRATAANMLSTHNHARLSEFDAATADASAVMAMAFNVSAELSGRRSSL